MVSLYWYTAMHGQQNIQLDGAVPVDALIAANIHIHFHGNRWPTFIPTFRCLPTHTACWTHKRHICQPFIFTTCRARKVKTPPHVLHCTCWHIPHTHATWPTLTALCPQLASILVHYCLLFLAMLWDAQFSDVFHELLRASSNLDRKWVRASSSDISITLQKNSITIQGDQS
jgi:hypothetical protein